MKYRDQFMVLKKQHDTANERKICKVSVIKCIIKFLYSKTVDTRKILMTAQRKDTSIITQQYTRVSQMDFNMSILFHGQPCKNRDTARSTAACV